MGGHLWFCDPPYPKSEVGNGSFSTVWRELESPAMLTRHRRFRQRGPKTKSDRPQYVSGQESGEI